MAMKKVSLTLDEELVAEARERSGNLSAFVNEALEARLRNARLGQLLAELDAEFGPVPPEVQAQAKRDMDEARARIARALAE